MIIKSALTVKDYVQTVNGSSAEFGIQGYYLQKTNAFDKTLNSRIWPGKKETYIDEAIKAKRGIPAANYNVMGDMIIKGHKSNLDKGERKTLPVEIALQAKKNNFPAPHHYNPNHKHTEKVSGSCLEYKGERHSVYSE